MKKRLGNFHWKDVQNVILFKLKTMT